jgi:hypothetical protein
MSDVVSVTPPDNILPKQAETSCNDANSLYSNETTYDDLTRAVMTPKRVRTRFPPIFCFLVIKGVLPSGVSFSKFLKDST